MPGPGYFRSLCGSYGGATLALAIGPLRMRLEGMSARQAVSLGGQFHPFVVDSDGDDEVRIDLRPAGVESFLRVRRDGVPESYRLESRPTGAGLALWSYEFAGALDATTGRAVLALVEEEGEPFRRGVENFLRVLTASYVLARGGFLLHAAVIVRRGRAYLFFGPSGSGKTTVTHLSPGDLVLSDDLALVVCHEGRFEAAGIPFGMTHHRVAECRASFPIASFNRLVQAREVRRRPLKGARALAEILGSLPFVMQETHQAARAMEVVGRALRSVPVFRLEFRRDSAFWEVVEAA